VPGRLPPLPGPPPGDPRRAPGGGELELRQHRALLWKGRRAHGGRPGAPGDVDAGPAPTPVRPCAPQHALAAAGPGGARLVRPAHRRGPARPVAAVLVAGEPLRYVSAGYEHAPRSGPDRARRRVPGRGDRRRGAVAEKGPFSAVTVRMARSIASRGPGRRPA